MAMNDQMQHEIAHIKLNRALTQVYADMNEELAVAPVGTSLDSTKIFKPEDHPDLIAGIGDCYDPVALAAVGVVMTKVSDTEVSLLATQTGSVQTLTFDEVRSDMSILNAQADLQLELAEMLAGEAEGAL